MVKIKQRFYGNVDEDGKLRLNNAQAFKDYKDQFKGQMIQLDLNQYKDTRSSNQNRYYWGVLVPVFADHFGMDNEEAHEALKWEHLRKKIKDRNGEERLTIGSTASMKTYEFEIYLEKLRRWGAMEFGLNIPEPNELPQ